MTRNWPDLPCAHCGTEGMFIAVVSIVKHKSQGTAQKPNGLVCFVCHEKADPGMMNQTMKIDQKIKELESLEQQKKDLEGARAALAKRKKPSRQRAQASKAS